MALGIDEFLDKVRAVLIAPETEGGVPELTDKNTMVFHHGESDPTEDIERGIRECKGVHVIILEDGGDNDPEDADAPVILTDLFIELFIDTTQRPRRVDSQLRLGGQIRDDIMQTLHMNQSLRNEQHAFYHTKVKGFRPIADPDYTAWRIRLQRCIYLHKS
ncbi:hypothetical protein JIN85_16900 [Luteolibacter pohnpeiensis]|uniref:Uncharacterized protein n=1 Tax=Luteolibacter pohnpeiensis TaxID=454153 RepID=A0A934SAU8_9BACT|nr:hypothetical protein [Luteolibacter pohnpeiensis]MBK1884101.1 hypothetical protein [Luteolibacter pohnpeiensis]